MSDDGDPGVEEMKGGGRGEEEDMEEEEEAEQTMEVDEDFDEEEDDEGSRGRAGRKRSRSPDGRGGGKVKARRPRMSDGPPETQQQLQKKLEALQEGRSDEEEEEEGGGEEEEDDEDDEGDEDEEEDEEMRAALGEEVRGKIRKKINKEGKPAEAGVLRKIYCENFMCHQKLSIELCPHVNFINGQNGSGKSAILAALQVCLGARASTTHRGGKLSDLIRQGHDGAAIVRVSLLNKGSDAYRHEDFGDVITVERRIERSGQSGYRLLAGNPFADQRQLRCVSTKRDDLDRMLDQFNIQVENPCALLDQENAKKFIGGDGGDKYKFFTRATDLDRIMESVRAAAIKVLETKMKLEVQTNDLHKHKDNWRKLKKELDEMESLSKIEVELKQARVDTVWARYHERKQQVDLFSAKVADNERKLLAAEAELAQLEQQYKDKGSEIEGKASELEEQRRKADEAKEVMMNLRLEITNMRQPLQQLEIRIGNSSEEIKDLIRKKKAANEKIREERSRVAGAAQAEDELPAKTEELTRIEDDLERLGQELQESQRQGNERLEQKERAVQDKRAAINRAQGVEREVKDADQTLRTLRAANGDELASYGDRMQAVVRAIHANRNKFRELPLGPMGLYIKIRDDYQEWKEPVENAIARVMENFLVTNPADQALLNRLVQQAGCNTSVLMVKKHRRYAPKPDPRGLLSVATCLQVEEDMVWNALLDWAAIDQACVVTRTSHVDRLLVDLPGGRRGFPGGVIRQAFDREGYVTTVYASSYSSRPFYWSDRQPRRLGVDKQQMVAMAQQRLSEAEGRVGEARAEVRAAEEQERSLTHEVNDIKTRVKKVRDLQAQLKQRHEQLQQEVAALQQERDLAAHIDVSDLEDEVAQFDRLIREAQQRQELVKAELKKKKEEFQPLEAKEANEKRRNAQILKELKGTEEALEQLKQALEGLQNHRAKYERTYEARKAKIRDDTGQRDQALQQLEQELHDIKAYSATELADEWDGQPRKPKHASADLSRRIKTMEKTLERERAQRHIGPDSIEVVRARMDKAKRVYEKKFKDIRTIRERAELLTRAIERRKKRARLFKKAIARNATLKFDDVLQTKGQSGGLDFNHKDRTLSLVVQKDNMDESTQSTNVKELSGGERSYSTMALLIALGESIESPFRVMDEFDIFMDAVSRKMAIELLLQMAANMEHRQFIFITPQDLSTVQVSDKVRIHKMRAPSRNRDGLVQTTLN